MTKKETIRDLLTKLSTKKWKKKILDVDYDLMRETFEIWGQNIVFYIDLETLTCYITTDQYTTDFLLNEYLDLLVILKKLSIEFRLSLDDVTDN